MTKILAISDLHGHLPTIEDDADVLVIAGDVVPATHDFHHTSQHGLAKQIAWTYGPFADWLNGLSKRIGDIVLTWGNHDWAAYKNHIDVPLGDRVHVLVNSGVSLGGVIFYGVPQQPMFGRWAFNERDVPEALGKRWERVPAYTDVLVTHGPPFGCCDRVVHGEHVGSKTQLAWMQSLQQPRLQTIVCGHIHESGGSVGLRNGITVYNVSHVDERYEPARGPREIAWQPR